MNQKPFYNFLVNFKFICEKAIDDLKEVEEMKQTNKDAKMDAKQVMKKTMKKLFTSVAIANSPANNVPSPDNTPIVNAPVTKSSKARGTKARGTKPQVTKPRATNSRVNDTSVADAPVTIIPVDIVPVDIALATNAVSEEIRQEKVKRKRRSRLSNAKDPLAPKHPRPAFAYYFKQESKQFQGQDQVYTGGQLAKMVGDQWKKLSSEEKQKYLDLAKNDRIRYQQELELYKSSKQLLSQTKAEVIEEKRENKIKKIIIAPELKKNKQK